jgi:hypothetical protein
MRKQILHKIVNEIVWLKTRLEYLEKQVNTLRFQEDRSKKVKPLNIMKLIGKGRGPEWLSTNKYKPSS